MNPETDIAIVERMLGSTTLSEDERLGLAIMLGTAPPLSYNDTVRGTQAFQALLERAGLDIRAFPRAVLAYLADHPDARPSSNDGRP